jgi:hypothetical protein
LPSILLPKTCESFIYRLIHRGSPKPGEDLFKKIRGFLPLAKQQKL